MVVQLVNKFLAFYGIKSSLLFSKKRVIEPYREPY
jgi:hypothetical protein